MVNTQKVVNQAVRTLSGFDNDFLQLVILSESGEEAMFEFIETVLKDNVASNRSMAIQYAQFCDRRADVINKLLEATQEIDNGEQQERRLEKKGFIVKKK